MKDFQKNYPASAASSSRSRYISLVVLSILMVFAFVLGGCAANLIPTTKAASVVTASTPSNSAHYPIQVFFSRYPDSVSTNFSDVYPVARISPTIAVATFSIQLLIAGPTLSEKQQGYFTEVNTLFSGSSNCSAPLPVGGPDFTLTLNKKGSVTEQGTATLKFCRTTNSPGIGTDARVIAEINATLKQFSNIKKVVILTKDGHCFGDESGKDFCLK